VDTTALKAQHAGLEESFRSTEALIADGDDLAVREFVGLLQARALAGGLNFLLEVERDVAKLLLHITYDLALSSGRERVPAFSQNLHQIVCQVTTSHIDTGDGVGQGETLVYGDNVGDTVTRIQHDTSGAPGSVKRKNGLDGDVESRGIEGFEDNLCHLFTVGLRVDGGFCKEDGVLLWSNTQLVVESVMPDLLHVVPIRDDTVLDGVSERQDTTFGLCLIANVGILLTHTNHNTIATSVNTLPEKVALGICTHGDEVDRQWKLCIVSTKVFGQSW